MGVQIQEMAYAFDCPTDTALFHTIFIHYDIFNYSNNDYHDVYIGVFTDFDIGYAYDDYIGCDSAKSFYYGYNGSAYDGTPGGQSGQYGAHPPAQAVVFLSDTMATFIAMSNTGNQTPLGPSIDSDYYYYMKGYIDSATHLTYGGNGMSGTVPTNYMYPGDPNDTTSWTDYHPYPDSTNTPYDRRGMGSIGPFNLAAGAKKSFDIAYVYARDTTKNNFENVTVLKQAVDKIRLYYANDSIPCGGSFSAIKPKSQACQPLKIYPVPSQNQIFIEYQPITKNCRYEIYDITGKQVQNGRLNQDKLHRLNLSDLKPAVYFIRLVDGSSVYSGKIVIGR